ncbi:hypothetical protein UP10_16455 [Bradyrhizobium sp. LTSPM299]|uniref:DUF6719 family protein n=1 Tax=Bradyrhizobium sp. LTSPM299 TaxID=1619233 RepID=UPI0005CB6130|nr:DUF6719 family protein [Bradyrhizobium sp. LTSPM299]KJC59737.1 hypothetical protein UP10_16455 [Bradyrhizobium sp. LTSPM299]
MGFGVLFSALSIVATNFGASAQQAQAVSHERNIVDLRVGQRVLVDDGSCPAGKIKLVTGAQLNQNGVVRSITCVPRFAKK